MKTVQMVVIGLAFLLGLALHSHSAEAQSNPTPLAVTVEPGDSATRLVLVAARGWKINARIKPALELPSGAIVRFDAARLTPDSAYFAEWPSARVPGRATKVRGTLRASVCAVGEQVCRLITLKL
jgi:hypothetical protein